MLMNSTNKTINIKNCLLKVRLGSVKVKGVLRVRFMQIDFLRAFDDYPTLLSLSSKTFFLHASPLEYLQSTIGDLRQ